MFHVPNRYRYRNHPTVPSENTDGNNGFFIFPFSGYKAYCQASDGAGWEHVSVSIDRPRTPTWEVMCKVKDLFWDEEDCVIQYHPPKSAYVNYYPYCLHLWRSTKFEIVVPDPLLVGPRNGVVI